MKATLNSVMLILTTLACQAIYASDHSHSDQDMTMHHMHIMINHAVEMAAEGSNLIMIGEMGMAGGMDEVSISHGKMMISHAKSLLKEVVGGDTMQSLHEHGASPEASDEMKYLHEFAHSAQEYIEMLGKMSAASAHGN